MLNLPDPDAPDDFYAIQTATGWRQMLVDFTAWLEPQPGWLALDLGSGPGLMPALLAARGCRALGVDVQLRAVRPPRLHPDLLVGDALRLPFAAARFDLLTASNLLFMLPEPLAALVEMRRVLRPGGRLGLLNPSEQMSVAAALELVERRNLEGLARQSLLVWAQRAERHRRWSAADLSDLCAAAGLRLLHSATRIGAGLARWAAAGRVQ